MTASLEELESVFTKWSGNSRGSPHVPTIARLLDAGYVSLRIETFDYSRRDVEAWLDSMKLAGMTGSNESRHHLFLKLVGAWFLDYHGHEMPKEPIPDSPENVPLYRYSGECYESRHRVGSRSHHEADVVCQCADGTTILEVGYTPAIRFLKSLGYGRSDLNDHPVTPEFFRREEASVEEFCVIPYRVFAERDGAVRVYCFQPTDSLPDPDKGRYYSRETEILEDVLAIDADEELGY